MVLLDLVVVLNGHCCGLSSDVLVLRCSIARWSKLGMRTWTADLWVSYGVIFESNFWFGEFDGECARRSLNYSPTPAGRGLAPWHHMAA
jgi:hypothetical protein